MCKALCHTFFPINDTTNKTSYPTKSIYFHWLRLLQVIFKDVCTDIANLKKETNNKFHRHLHKLMHTTADTIFYKNYILHYVNILDHLDHDLVIHNNKIERIKSNLHLKCRNFISGLHILARNHIPESILHADVFFQIYCMEFHNTCSRIMCILCCIVCCQSILWYGRCKTFHLKWCTFYDNLSTS